MSEQLENWLNNHNGQTVNVEIRGYHLRITGELKKFPDLGWMVGGLSESHIYLNLEDIFTIHDDPNKPLSRNGPIICLD